MQALMQKFHRQPYLIALVFAILLLLWILSGMLKQPEAQPAKAALSSESKTTVQVKRLVAQSIARTVTLYGRSEPDRTVALKAEVAGRVIAIEVDRGLPVRKGQVIATIDMQDRQERLHAAQSLVEQRKTEYAAAKELKTKGYQAGLELSRAQAALDSAKAQVKQLQVQIDNTQIVSPFDGVLNLRHIEQGDYLNVGDPIAELVDLSPLVVHAQVTERHHNQLSLGMQAKVRFPTGQNVTGNVRYIASVSQPGTNTFHIEVAIPQATGLAAGLSAEVDLILANEQAVKISPSVIALDENGELGVKQVIDDKVNFVAIDIVKSDPDGVWLSGLGNRADVIVLGQGFVRDGDDVIVEYTDQ